MRDLVAHHCGQLVIRDIQALDQAGVDRDLAARHAPGVDVLGSNDIGLPLPARGIAAKRHRRWREARGNGTHPGQHRGIGVQGFLFLRLTQYLSIGFLRVLVDLLGGHQHGLLTLNTDHTRLCGLHRLAGAQCQQHRRPDQQPVLPDCFANVLDATPHDCNSLVIDPGLVRAQRAIYEQFIPPL